MHEAQWLTRPCGPEAWWLLFAPLAAAAAVGVDESAGPSTTAPGEGNHRTTAPGEGGEDPGCTEGKEGPFAS